MWIEGSALADVDDGLGKGGRSLLGQIVPDATLHEAVQIFAGEFFGISGRVRMRRPILVAFEGDGRYTDLRCGRQFCFQLVQAWIALGKAKAPSIVMDHDIDVIWIIERRRARGERRVIKLPFG